MEGVGWRVVPEDSLVLEHAKPRGVGQLLEWVITVQSPFEVQQHPRQARGAVGGRGATRMKASKDASENHTPRALLVGDGRASRVQDAARV